MTRRVTILVALAVLAVMGACGGGGGDEMGVVAETQRVEGAGVDVTVTLDRSSASMSDEVEIRVWVRLDGESVRDVQIDVAESEAWTGVRRRSIDEGGEGRGLGVSVTLEPFLPGELETPEITVTPLFGDGEAGEAVVVAPMRVEVASAIEGDPEEAELADVKSVVDPPEGRGVLIAIGAAVVLGGAAVLAIVMLVSRRRGASEQEEVVPPDEAARRALEALRQQRLVESGRIKVFYFELSMILRRYIEGRFGLDAPDRTTEEFLREARGSVALGTGDVEVLERFLDHCDLVKFAKLPVDAAQAEVSLRTVSDFVERTRLIEPSGARPGGGVAS